MKERVSFKAVEVRVEQLNRELGRPLEPWTKVPTGCNGNAGNFHVDSDLGGYRIEEQLAGGGAHPTFGHQRMTKRELVNQLDAILAAIMITKRYMENKR